MEILLQLLIILSCSVVAIAFIGVKTYELYKAKWKVTYEYLLFTTMGVVLGYTAYLHIIGVYKCIY